MQNNNHQLLRKAAVLILSVAMLFVSVPVSAATASESGTVTSTDSSSGESSTDSDTETEDKTSDTTVSDTQISSSSFESSGTTTGSDDINSSDTSASSDSGASDSQQSTETTETVETEQNSEVSSTDASDSNVEDQESGTEDAEDVTTSSSSTDESEEEDQDPLLHRITSDFEDSSSSVGIQLFAASASTSDTPTLPSKYQGYNVSKGVDVSVFQGDIDWTKVKNAGIDFAIIRIGYTGYGNGKLYEDNNALTNLKNAKAAGLKVGAYYFSKAITTDEAASEAKKALEIVKSSGVSLDLPLFMDYEYTADDDRLQVAKNNGLSKSMMTSIVMRFCATVSAGDCKAGIYANKSMLEDDLNYSEIQSAYTVWLAHWTMNATNYAGSFSYWQYSGDSATVSGISGVVDLDVRLTKNVKTEASVDATAYVQNKGLLSTVSDGETAGTTGEGLRLEAFSLTINSDNYSDSSISYSAHVQDIGWQDYVSDGELSGTTEQSRRVEAIKVKLTGTIASDYDVWYRVHVQDIGWMNWTSNNSVAGTTGMSLRIEAIQVMLVPKGEGAPANTDSSTTVSYMTNPGISYQAHVQNEGWMSTVKNGATAGTTGKGLRVEALKVNLSASELGIAYRLHIQGTGWESSWKSSGQVSGTTGQKRQVEAIQIKLTGTMASCFNVYYRVHVQNIGWLAWAKNGATAGTTGCSLRVEAIQIVIRSKAESAPSDSDSVLSLAALSTQDVQYRAHVQNIGWQSYVKNGATAGTTGRNLRVEAVQISTTAPGLGVEYRTHIQNSGWESSWHSSGTSGTVGKGLRLEAIQIRLTGVASKYFDI